MIPNQQLAELRRAGVVFPHDIDDDDDEISINMNDTFGWAIAEGENITLEEVPIVYDVYFNAPHGTGGHAITRWVCKRRGYEPFDLWKEKYGWPDPK